MKHKYVFPFLEPVDWKGLELDDYPKIIKNPIDLGTIKMQLEKKQYWLEPFLFLRDMTLMFDNCYHYNEPWTDVSDMARQLQHIFIQYLSASALFTPEQIKYVRECNPNMYDDFHQSKGKHSEKTKAKNEQKDKKDKEETDENEEKEEKEEEDKEDKDEKDEKDEKAIVEGKKNKTKTKEEKQSDKGKEKGRTKSGESEQQKGKQNKTEDTPSSSRQRKEPTSTKKSENQTEAVELEKEIKGAGKKGSGKRPKGKHSTPKEEQKTENGKEIEDLKKEEYDVTDPAGSIISHPHIDIPSQQHRIDTLKEVPFTIPEMPDAHRRELFQRIAKLAPPLAEKVVDHLLAALKSHYEQQGLPFPSQIPEPTTQEQSNTTPEKEEELPQSPKLSPSQVRSITIAVRDIPATVLYQIEQFIDNEPESASEKDAEGS